MQTIMRTASHPPAKNPAVPSLYRELGQIDGVHAPGPTLHPDTDPARIREIQTQDVFYAHQVLGTTDVMTISDYTDLPRWNVERALTSLGLEVVPVAKKVKPRPLDKKMVDALASRKWLNLHKISTLVDEPVSRVINWIRKNGKRIEKRMRADNMGKEEGYWRLKVR